jgi:lipopolysaccharide export system permease protein
MYRLTRYVLRQSLGVALFVTAALSAAIWLAQSLRLIDLIVNRGLTLDLFIYLALLILPRFLDIVLPIGVFIAVLFTYNKLLAESEIVVMRAAGMSQLGLAKPALALATIAWVVLFAMSAYFLPASNRAFKDLQFTIRNQFASAVLQDGTFSTLSDRITVYVRGRDANGELTGLLVQDERDRTRPVTIIAERGAMVGEGDGSRVFMVNGTRQQYDRASGRLSVLSFEKYTLDLAELRDAPTGRSREPQERALWDLWFDPATYADPTFGSGMQTEAHRRLVQPLTAFALGALPLAFLLSGEFNRRGQTRRVLLAVLFGFLFIAADLGIQNLAGRVPAAIPMMYANVLAPVLAALWLLLRDARRGARRAGRFAPAAT